LLEGKRKSILKESYILNDPNLAFLKDASRYTPQIGSKDKVVDLGEYTMQKYSGEWTSVDKAHLLRRRSVLLAAIIEALKIANEAEAVESDLTAAKVFDYLHRGK
jgi:hypothetical protein